MKEGCWEAAMTFAYRIPGLPQEWLCAPSSSSESNLLPNTSPMVEKPEPLQAMYSTLLLHYHENPSPNTQPTYYSSGTWETALVFAAAFHIFKESYKNISFFSPHLHFTSIMLNSSTLFSISLKVMCPGSVIAQFLSIPLTLLLLTIVEVKS